MESEERNANGKSEGKADEQSARTAAQDAGGSNDAQDAGGGNDAGGGREIGQAQDGETRKQKKTILIICIAAAIVIVALAVGLIVALNKGGTQETASYEFEEGQEKPASETREGSVASGIQIPGYKSITIEAGTKDVTVELTNPESNNVYFEISLYLPESDETIYTSKLIKPGDSIYEIELTREMEAGEYDLTVIYNTYSADEEMTPRNGAQVNTTLIVK